MTDPRSPYISTDLRVLVDVPAETTATDLIVGGKAYRLLDPDYYAWLRHKMDLAKSAFSRGRLPEPTFDALRDRFNALHDLAIALFGESTLHQAVWALDPKTYAWPQVPPALTPPVAEPPSEPSVTPPPVSDPWSNHQLPEDPGDYRFLQPVLRSALDKVHAIRDRALAAGWTDSRLYQNRGRFAFPCGDDYGLVCFVHPDQALGVVTPRAIEIVCAAGHSLHFYRNGGQP